MKRLLKSTFASPIALIINLLLAYLIYFFARLTYVLVNYSYFAEGIRNDAIGQWIKGSLMFDTTAILYTHIPYIILMLFPEVIGCILLLSIDVSPLYIFLV